MLANRINIRVAGAVVGAALGLTAAVQAQPCLPSTATGREIRQFSRNLSGRIVPGKSTINPNAFTTVIMYNCQPVAGVVGVKSRQVNYAQMSLDFSIPTDCDELPLLKGRLVGDYFSLTRITDPFTYTTPPVNNTRIGRHNASGNVYDTSSPPVIIGTFRMSGTIGSNTQRPASLFGVGTCYFCQHHEGLITIKLNQSPVFVGSGQITATYSWDVSPNSPDCTSDPCKMEQLIDRGTMDGMIEAGCGTIMM